MPLVFVVNSPVGASVPSKSKSSSDGVVLLPEPDSGTLSTNELSFVLGDTVAVEIPNGVLELENVGDTVPRIMGDDGLIITPLSDGVGTTAIVAPEESTVGISDNKRPSDGDGDGTLVDIILLSSVTLFDAGGVILTFSLILTLEHFPAAQNPPTTAPATSNELRSSAVNMIVIQNRRSDIGDGPLFKFSELLVRWVLFSR